MPLGAIVKAGAKSLAKEKAKSFITGKGKGKGGALKKVGEQKPKVNPSNLMGRQVGGDTGGADIPASKQTINVTALGSDSPVSSGGGSGDIKIVQDISVAVSAIAESMQNSLTLKEKAQNKKRKAAERDKRAAQEADVEKPDKPKKEGGGMPNIKVPGVGLLSGVFGFITKFIYGIVIMKLIEFAPQLKKVLGLFKLAQPLFNGITNLVGGAFDLLTTFVDFGYKIADGAEQLVTKIFGEEGAEKFRTFMENVKNLINAFIIWKVVGEKIFKAVIKNIKNAFKLVKNFIKRGAKLVTKLFPNFARGATKLFQKGAGLASKGLAKVGGFAAKIFGKAASFIAPGFKAAKPFASKFFSKIPIVGPLVVTIVSLLSGEPATQAIFKGLGAALGGALGTFIPIPILGTLIGETIGVFVGDLFYSLLFGGGISEVGQKLKDTFMTIFKGGKAVFDFFKNGFGNFISTFMEEHSFKLPGWLSGSIKGVTGIEVSKIPNLLQLYNPMVVAPLLIKSFFGKKEESGGKDLKQEEAKISTKQDNKNGKNAEAVAAETTYESGEGNAVIIPVPVQQTKEVAIKNKRGRTVGYKTVVIDDTELAMYGGK